MHPRPKPPRARVRAAYRAGQSTTPGSYADDNTPAPTPVTLHHGLALGDRVHHPDQFKRIGTVITLNKEKDRARVQWAPGEPRTWVAIRRLIKTAGAL